VKTQLKASHRLAPNAEKFCASAGGRANKLSRLKKSQRVPAHAGSKTRVEEYTKIRAAVMAGEGVKSTE
jgi:hypothetical protein